jgi:hypothetical protein
MGYTVRYANVPVQQVQILLYTCRLSERVKVWGRAGRVVHLPECPVWDQSVPDLQYRRRDLRHTS